MVVNLDEGIIVSREIINYADRILKFSKYRQIRYLKYLFNNVIIKGGAI